MSLIKEKIEGDLKDAMKGRDDFKVGALRFLLSSIQGKEIDKRGKGFAETLSDEEAEDVLRKEYKKRKESFEIYSRSGRSDLASGEEKEMAVIESYLPPRVSSAEVRKIIDDAVAAIQLSGPGDFGRVMGEVMKKAKGADGSEVSRIIKEKLAG